MKSTSMAVRFAQAVSFFSLLINASLATAALSADEIAATSAMKDRISAWSAFVEIQDFVADELKRTRKGELSTRQNESEVGAQRYYHFVSPQDIRGTSLLIHEHPAEQDDIWLYLPYLGKSRRIAGSAKKNSFVGTQYSFADLTSFEHERYAHVIETEENCVGKDCWVLTSTPKDGSYAREIGYSKLQSWVEKDSMRIVKIDYYDMAGALLKTQELSDFASADHDKSLALTRVMVNHQKEQRSLIRFTEPDFDAYFEDEDFSAYRLGEE